MRRSKRVRTEAAISRASSLEVTQRQRERVVTAQATPANLPPSPLDAASLAQQFRDRRLLRLQRPVERRPVRPLARELRTVGMFGSAPASSSARHISSWPAAAAVASGVSCTPPPSRRFGSAPLDKSSRATSTCPNCAATVSGVCPRFSCRKPYRDGSLGSTPRRSDHRAPATSPRAACPISVFVVGHDSHSTSARPVTRIAASAFVSRPAFTVAAF